MRCERNNKGHINTHHYTRPIIHCFSWSLACVFSSQLPAHSSNARTDRPDLAESTWLKGHRIKWTKSSLPEAHHITQLMHFQVNQPFYQKKIIITINKKKKQKTKSQSGKFLELASSLQVALTEDLNWRKQLMNTSYIFLAARQEEVKHLLKWDSFFNCIVLVSKVLSFYSRVLISFGMMLRAIHCKSEK